MDRPDPSSIATLPPDEAASAAIQIAEGLTAFSPVEAAEILIEIFAALYKNPRALQAWFDAPTTPQILEGLHHIDVDRYSELLKGVVEFKNDKWTGTAIDSLKEAADEVR